VVIVVVSSKYDSAVGRDLRDLELLTLGTKRVDLCGPEEEGREEIRSVTSNEELVLVVEVEVE
jgi:hypothetical protein